MTPPVSETKRRLVETAARLFHERGYAATGVATVLREAGLHSGSLYHHFSGKEGLLAAVLEAYIEWLHPRVLDPVEEAEPDPVERVFALLAWYREGLERSGCRLGCPVANLALEVSDTHPQVRPLIDANLAGWAAGVRDWLEEGAERWPPGCDLDALSRFVLTVMEGSLVQVRAANSLRPFDQSVAVLRDHVDRLLADGRAHLAPANPRGSKVP